MTNLLLKNGTVYVDGALKKADLLIEDGIITKIEEGIFEENCPVVDIDKLYIIPGLTDVHVHLREPGYSYKETIATGTRAAARGGFTTVCAMPNLNPVPDSPEHLKVEQDIIDRDAVVNVLPYAAITVGEKGKELADIEGMRDKCFAFSDDGKGVQSEDMMLAAMRLAAKHGKAIVAHCEDESLLHGGYIHDGEYARLHGHRGICSESEWGPVKRDCELAKESGVHYHVCHISAKETVDIIRDAKKRGINVTCETGPHYLALTDTDIGEHGRFKMNPPIRSKEDRDALIKGVQDGTIDCIITDHAPHSAEEKSKGLAGSSMGVVGLETSFAAINTFMVEKGYISFEKLVEIMAINPKKIFGMDAGIKVGEKADIAIVDRYIKHKVNPEEFVSMGKFTPFEGMTLTGDVMATICNGKIVYNRLTDIKE